MPKTPEEFAAETATMAAFERDPATWRFREYWQSHDQRFIELTEFIEQVASGKIIVSNDIVHRCRETLLQINQIAYALTEASKEAGQQNLVTAMNIAYSYDARAAAARTSLQIILGWQV